MDKLLEGVATFRRDGYVKRRELFGVLASGQKPRTLFVACSDSRVLPNLITASEPGDLFVVRNAGNLVPLHGTDASGVDAAVEFAVVALGVEHIVVCGHSGCGAMKGLLAPESLASMPSVAHWLKHAAPTLEATDASEDTPADERLERTVEANALCQVDNLRGHPCVAKALEGDALSLHAWVYDIPSGQVRAYDGAQGAFVELTDKLYPVEATRPAVSSAVLVAGGPG